MRFVVLITVGLLIAGIVDAAVIHIPADQPTIQAGIDVAVSGDTVLVSPGIYTETISFNGFDIVLGSLFLTTGDTAFIGSTVIDADSSGSCVSLSNGESSAARLCGLTLTNGFSQLDFGGGINCIGASPRLDHLRIHHCSAQFGGGMYSAASGSVVSEVLVEDNQAFYGSGGGFYLDESPLNIENSIFRNNSGGHGGGIHCSQSNVTLTNVQLIDNTAGFGGGLSCWYNSNGVLNNVIITGNTAQVSGGGLNCRFSSAPDLNHVLISNNSASYGGGVNFVGEGCDAVLDYVTIVDNYASTSGGGIQCGDQAEPHFSNLTVSRNTADFWGDGLYNYHADPVLDQTLFWNNQPQEIYFQASGDPGSITISCSDIAGGQEGIFTNGNGTVNWLMGNFSLDPLFCSASSADFRLAASSPCLPGNHPEGVACGLIGAQESGCDNPLYPVADLAIEVIDTSLIHLTWSSVTGATGYTVYRSIDPYAEFAFWELMSEQLHTDYQEQLPPIVGSYFYTVTSRGE